DLGLALGLRGIARRYRRHTLAEGAVALLALALSVEPDEVARAAPDQAPQPVGQDRRADQEQQRRQQHAHAGIHPMAEPDEAHMAGPRGNPQRHHGDDADLDEKEQPAPEGHCGTLGDAAARAAIAAFCSLSRSSSASRRALARSSQGRAASATLPAGKVASSSTAPSISPAPSLASARARRA